ncbi:hypothetical protein AB3S75_041738 [Citrus x aurantiifolia]
MSSIGIEDTDAKLKINSELYNALMIKKDEQNVIELCRKVPDHKTKQETLFNMRLPPVTILSLSQTKC